MNVFKNLWFRDVKESPVYINDVAVRIRAGMMLLVPLYMGLTLFDVRYGSNWLVDGNTASDTFETDWDGQIIYAVEAVKRTYKYTTQSWVLIYALFDMIAGMSVRTAWFSPTIWLSSFLAKKCPPAVWKPLLPKRFAWTIGAILISICLAFFNPDTLAEMVNAVTGEETLPTTYNYMPGWIPTTLVWICLGFMWLETVLGFCVGCQVHALLVKVGILKTECEACNNIDWEALAKKNQAKLEEEQRKNH